MDDHITGKSIVITGAASGFGRLVSEKAAARGARVTCGDINHDGLHHTVTAIEDAGGIAQACPCDVTDIDDMKAMAAKAVDAYGAIDVMINNAGTMPLAFYADHEAALAKWHRCIDINIKGVLNGIVCAYDQMMAQGHGHVINISSIYSNFPVAGSAVYQATKSAVNFLSESLRVEARGSIKVTVVRPTGVPTTGIGSEVVNPEAGIGIAGQNFAPLMEMMTSVMEGKVRAANLDPKSAEYAMLAPDYIADQIIHAIDQPRGVVLGDITVRATGDYFVL